MNKKIWFNKNEPQALLWYLTSELLNTCTQRIDQSTGIFKVPLVTVDFEEIESKASIRQAFTD